MNPGLIPPADVAAAAKKGLEPREKSIATELRSAFIAQSSWRSAGDVSLRDITAISAYFARHEVDKASKSHE
jgi:hypothetical protein